MYSLHSQERCTRYTANSRYPREGMKESAPRDRPFDPDDWWWDLVKEARERSSLGQEELALRVSELAGRTPPWNRSKVSRFFDRDNVTAEFVEALSRLWSIPRPVFVPASEEDAKRLEQALSEIPSSKRGTTAHNRALPEIDRVADLLDPSADGGVQDHTEPLPLSDAPEAQSRGSGRGRGGGARGGRTKAARR